MSELSTPPPRSRRLIGALPKALQALGSDQGLQATLELIMGQLAEVIHCHAVWLLIVQGDRLVLRAACGAAQAPGQKGFALPLSDPSTRTPGQEEHPVICAVSTRRPVLLPEVAGASGRALLPGPDMRSLVCVPLLGASDSIGALVVGHHLADAFDPLDTDIAALFAQIASQSIVNARRFYHTQERVRELSFLNETSQALTASLDVDEVLASLMSHMRDYFRVAAASIALLEEGGSDLVFQVAAGEAAQAVVGMRMAAGQGIAGYVLQTGQAILSADVRKDPRFYSGVDDSTGFRTQELMAAPVRIGTRTIGVVEVLNPTYRPFDESDLRLLTSVADMAASAIQNARLFTRAHQAELQYQSLFDESADPIFVLDTRGGIIDANREAMELVGRSKDVMLGHALHEYFNVTPDNYAQYLKRALAEGAINTLTVTVPAAGTQRTLESRVRKVTYGGAQAVQWVGHDISERVELEHMRENLTHMIVHDLRNPLGSIINSLELIEMSLSDKDPSLPLDQLFAIARRSGQKLYHLIDSLLDMARLESGETRLEKTPVVVSQLIDEVLELVQPTAMSHHHQLGAYVDPRLASIPMDRDMILRVLTNLLDNAIKYTDSDGIIRLAVRRASETAALFSVEDNGPGIPLEYQQMVFNRFQRARRQNGGPRGVGLGLAFCKLAVEAHGGHIWVESAPKSGTAFRFTLPLTEPSS